LYFVDGYVYLSYKIDIS